MKKPISIFNIAIKNASSESVDIYIDGDIVDASTQEVYKNWLGDDTSVSFRSFRNEIAKNPSSVYNVYINSGGGLVTDAMAMHDFLVDLQKQGKTVNTIGTGIVASAATYILMAGKTASMTKNSWFMIHNVSGGVYGPVDIIEQYATTLRNFNDRTRDFYSEYTSMRKEDISKLMNAETFMTADQAKEKGFIKNVTDEVAFKNSISTEIWDEYKYPTTILNAYNSSVAAPPADNPISDLKNLLNDMKVSFKSITDALKGTKPANADASTIVNALIESLSPAFDAVATQIETDVNTAISNSVTKLTTDITASLEAKYEERIKALEANNKQLEKDLENGLGGESKPNNEAGPKVKGTFAKKAGAL